METTNGFKLEQEGIWLNLDTMMLETCQPLIPTDWPLTFHRDFIDEIARNPNIRCIGDYTMGWEL